MATLPACAVDSVVVFNEMHYHPAGDNSALEFVELYNQLAVDVDLSNWRLDGDIRFDFPEGTVLGGRDYVVIAKNPLALATATGFSGALGPFDGFISNSGDPIFLYSNNRSFRTADEINSDIPADKLWSVDLQGDGNGGAYGQLAPPTLMTGVEAGSGLGGVWNALTVAGHSMTTTDPSLALVDSLGAASSVMFSMDGTVSGWSQPGSALVSDYLFVNAGFADPAVTWQFSGLVPGETYSLYAYGGVSRDIGLTIDWDGDGSLADETAVLASGGGLLISDITADVSGLIIGKAEPGSVSEGNWGGFHLFEQQAATVAPAGTATDSLRARRIMDRLDSTDMAPWPVGPDGSGFTLAKLDPNSGTGHPEHWTTSGPFNGTPGGMNVTSAMAPLAINEAAASTGTAFQLELYNYGDVAVPLGGVIIGSSNPLHGDYVFPARVLQPGEFAAIDHDDLGYIPIANNRLFLFTAGRTGLIDVVRIGERARARFPDGTGRWLHPDGPTFGSANTVTLEEAVVINEIFYHAYPQMAAPGTPSGRVDLPVVDFDSVWRYNLDAGIAGLPSGWASTAHAVDGISWARGPGLLGEESSTLGEPMLTALTLTAQIPYYFETEFSYNDPEEVVEMVIDHYTDDGAVFYLNGIELDRFNMPAGALAPTTLASSPGVSDATQRTLVIPAPGVLQGSNRLSVEVHQINSGSSDVVFGARVTLRKSDGTGTPGTSFAERDEEWIELYNRGSSPVDLTGWKLAGGIDFDFPAAASIPAEAYLVVAKDAVALGAKHPGAAVIGDYSNRLGNGGDQVVLEDARGNPADEVRYYDHGKWHAAADGGGSSLELRDPDADNSRAGAWAPSDEGARSGWRTYTYEGTATDDGIGYNVYHEFLLGLLDAGEMLLDDVSVLENGSLELIQNGDFEGDTPGVEADTWRVLGTHGSHGRTVVVTDPEDGGNQCLHVVATGPTGDKHNKLETTLASGRQVVPGNTYRIRFRAKWLSGSSQVNTRLYFNYLQRTTHIDVPETWGTPGAANSAAVVNAGPTYAGLRHEPVVPSSGQAVTVSVASTDPDGIGDLTLYYSVDGGAFQGSVMSLGTDNRYTGVIPGQATGKILRFYVGGRDTLNATSSHPASGPEAGAFYKVQDGYADTSGLRHNFRIVMDERDRVFLFDGTNRMSNDRFAVTVIEDEETAYYDVGLRFKASAFGRFQTGHYGFNIQFQPDHLFRGVHRTISIERSPVLKEILAKHLMNRAGGGYWSFYDDVAHIITPNAGDRGPGLLSMARHTSTFFDGLFPEADAAGTLFNHELLYNPNGTTGGPEGLKIGNPYNHNNGHYDLVDRGEDKEPYRWGFQIRSSRDRDDYGALVALNQAMSLSGSALEAALDPLIDVDQWMRTCAMASLNGTDDIFGRLYEHNIRYYVRPTDGKIILLQWDLDRAFQLGTTSSVTPTRNTIAKMFSLPRYRRLFDGHLDDLVKTTFNANYVTPWASHFSILTGDHLNGLVGYIGGRAGHVLGQLPAEIPFAITTNGGADFSEADSVIDLEGQGWIDVFSIMVNGFETPVTWVDDEHWRITIPIGLGPNPLTLTAINYHGVEVGTDVITVTNTSAIDVANPGNLALGELHYHPADPTAAEQAATFDDADFFEFVEFINTSDAQIDLSGVRFTDGVVFDFPIGTLLGPGERLVVVADRAAFAFRYGTGSVTVAGEYSGEFRNSGEHVRLEAADGTPIADFSYGDVHPWPEGADGGGTSLVRAGGDLNDPLSWRSSVAPHGTPGGSDALPFSGDPDALLDYALGGKPMVQLNGDHAAMVFLHNLASDDAAIGVEFSIDLVTWFPAGLDQFVLRVNNGDGTATHVWECSHPVFSTSRKGFARVCVRLR